MTGAEFFAGQRSVNTPSGEIHYVERGSGRVALFVHGVLLNSYLWRHQLAELGDLRRCVAVEIEKPLRRVQAPTLIAWGTDDIFFDPKWSHWLQKTIPGTKRRVEFKGARIFFPEERSREFNQEVRAHWAAISEG